MDMGILFIFILCVCVCVCVCVCLLQCLSLVFYNFCCGGLSLLWLNLFLGIFVATMNGLLSLFLSQQVHYLCIKMQFIFKCWVCILKFYWICLSVVIIWGRDFRFAYRELHHSQTGIIPFYVYALICSLA
jgi:hypothetical protein